MTHPHPHPHPHAGLVLAPPLSPRLLVATASAFIGLCDDSSVRPTLAATVLRRACAQESLDSSRWSAAFVHHAGYWSHYHHGRAGSIWPLPPVATCDELAVFAKQHGVLSIDEPEHGDLYLQWSPMHLRYTSVGIVLDVIERGTRYALHSRVIVCNVIEAVIGAADAPNRLGVDRAVYQFRAGEGDRIIPWTRLLSDTSMTDASDAGGEQPFEQARAA